MRKVKIGSKSIGDRERCFIVFEAGPTHFGLESAIKLVDMAVAAGADAIKFQMMDVDKLVADHEYTFSYGILKDKRSGEVEVVEEPLYKILKRRELNKDAWRQLKNYCDGKKMQFFSTACFNEDVDFLVNELNVPTIKINSGDVIYLDLIEYAAKKNVNIQLDTGSSEIWEIERAVRVVEDTGSKNIIIHHCPTGYPARLESIHLNMIKTLRTMFDYPIAFSDHSPGYAMDIAALSLGANLLEKTITLDRTIRSCEHMFSLEENEARDFIKTIREVEIAMGENRRILTKDAREGKLKARRSAFAGKDLEKGTVLNPGDIIFQRPGYGILPDQVDNVIGRKLNKKVKAGQMITREDLV